MKKVFSLLLITVIILSVFSGCSEKGVDEQLIYPIDNDPVYLDPQIASGTAAQNIIANVFEGLVTFDTDGNIVPAAAESFEISSDSKIYTFHLRKDLKWMITSSAGKLFDKNETPELFNEKGDPELDVTVDDFVFAFRRAVNPETGSLNASLLKSIKNAAKISVGELSANQLGVTKQDDYTLIIELEKPDCDFLYTLTLPLCMPCNQTFFEKTRGRYGLSSEYLIFNGPFFISNWSEGKAVSTRKNEKYHSQEDVKPYSIYFSINNEWETRGEKVKNATYQVAPLDKAQKAELEKSKGIEIKNFNNSINALLLNCNDEVLANADIRKAIVSAFDPEIFLEKSGKERSPGIVPSSSLTNGSSYRERAGSLSYLPFDKEQARTYYTSGTDKLNLRGIDLTVLCSVDDEFAVRSVMQQWQSAFGVSFSIGIETVDSKTLRSRLESGDYQLAIADVSFSNSTALNCLISFCTGRGNNIYGLKSSKYDALIEAVKSTKSTSEYIAALKKAEKYLISGAVIVPIFENETYQGIAKGVEGVTISPSVEVVYFKEGLKK